MFVDMKESGLRAVNKGIHGLTTSLGEGDPHFCDRDGAAVVGIMPECHGLAHTQEVSENSDQHTNVKDLVRGAKVIQFSWEETLWHTACVQKRSNDI